MDARLVEKVLELAAPVDRVWRAISDPAELSRWFGHETEFDLEPDGDGAFVWREHGRYAVRVQEVDPPRRLVWSWVHEPGFLTDVHHSQNNGGCDEELAELVTLVSA